MMVASPESFRGWNRSNQESVPEGQRLVSLCCRRCKGAKIRQEEGIAAKERKEHKKSEARDTSTHKAKISRKDPAHR
jgi:hypothetical protein